MRLRDWFWDSFWDARVWMRESCSVADLLVVVFILGGNLEVRVTLFVHCFGGVGV